MNNDRAEAWVWGAPCNYDMWTASNAGLDYEYYHDLLDLIVVRCHAGTGDRVLNIGTGSRAGCRPGSLAVELEEECLAHLETLAPMSSAAGLSFAAERLSRINWVVWEEKRREALC